LFGRGILDIKIEFFITIAASLILFYVFVGMSYGYTKKRINQNYAIGRNIAPSLKSFAILSKMLFVSSMLVTLLCYWFSWSFLLLVYRSHLAVAIGAILILVGYFSLKRSFDTLGNNYSPLFDAYVPFELVTSGVYSRVRHPIYLFNLFISFGLALSSGSALVLVNAIVGLCYILRAIYIEEKYLKDNFSSYSSYCQRTWRLIPYIF
jgi:protein-S-isoprenylcysteine O-methyltransferase Ste14